MERALPVAVHVYNYGVEFGPLPRRFHAHGQAGQESLDYDVGLHADHGVYGPVMPQSVW